MLKATLKKVLVDETAPSGLGAEAGLWPRCLHEVLVNAIKHGNKENSSRTVHVIIKAKGKKLAREVTDQGQGFEFSVVSDAINGLLKGKSLKFLEQS